MLVWLATVFAMLVGGQAQGSLIANGDFEAGNTGFATQYTYFPPVWSLWMGGSYTVCKNPAEVGGFDSLGDHTSGTGEMMVVNGGDPNLVVWSQNVTLAPGSTYKFSAWSTEVYDVGFAHLTFQIGGNALGDLQLTSLPEWQEFSASFVAVSGSAELVIRDISGEFGGNDFALDDISLVPVSPAPIPEPATLIIWSLVGGLGVAHSLCFRKRAANHRGQSGDEKGDIYAGDIKGQRAQKFVRRK